MVGELVSEGRTTSLALPIRETVQNGEILYSYVRDTIGKIKRSFIDSNSIRGTIYRDGTFKVSFVVLGSAARDLYAAAIPCEVKGVKEGDVLVPVIEFPSSYRNYGRIREILRDLEEHLLRFSAWREMQMKMRIVREAPKKRKTLDEILTEIKDIVGQTKGYNRKLQILEAEKRQLSETVYSEFKKKYTDLIEGNSKRLRSMAVGLEPYSNQLQEEIDEIRIRIERFTMAYGLDEIGEEEYVRNCGPLRGRLDSLRKRKEELQEVLEFLKTPYVSV